MKKIWTVLNLVFVMVIAFAFTTFLHEFAHAVTAKLVGVRPILFHSSVSYDDTTVATMAKVVISASGPLISLLQAEIFFLVRKRRKHTYDRSALFFFWAEVIGMIVFCGYMIMGAFVRYGDTGKIYTALNIPEYVSSSISVLAFAIIVLFLRKTVPVFTGFMRQLQSETGYGGRRTVLLSFVAPVFLATVIDILLSLPAPAAASLAFPIVIPLFMIPVALRLGSAAFPSRQEAPTAVYFSRNPFGPLLFMILALLLSRVLSQGIAF